MGYYSRIAISMSETVLVDVEKARKMEHEYSDEYVEKHEEWDKKAGFTGVKINIMPGTESSGIGSRLQANLRSIELEDYYAKFYGDFTFANDLSRIIIEGLVELMFVGEDGLIWGYRVESRKITELSVAMLSIDELRLLHTIKTAKQNFLDKWKVGDIIQVRSIDNIDKTYLSGKIEHIIKNDKTGGISLIVDGKTITPIELGGQYIITEPKPIIINNKDSNNDRSK